MLLYQGFTNHAAHHLFPTVDFSKLWLINPLIKEACREMKLEHLYPTHSFGELLSGYTQFLVRKKPSQQTKWSNNWLVIFQQSYGRANIVEAPYPSWTAQTIRMIIVFEILLGCRSTPFRPLQFIYAFAFERIPHRKVRFCIWIEFIDMIDAASPEPLFKVIRLMNWRDNQI